MPTTVPTKTDDSIGRVLRDRPRELPADLRYEMPAEVMERIKDALIAYGVAIVDLETGGAASGPVKSPVRVASVVDGTLGSSFQNGSVVNGTTLATNDRILIMAQTSAVENGIYIVNASGAPTRASDMLAGDNVAGVVIVAQEGTAGADGVWVCTTDAPSDEVGTDALTFAQVGGGSVFADDVFRVQDNGDATKQVAIEASGITTGNTRTITMPDKDVSLGTATATAEGLVELATQAEADTGTDPSRVVTPDTLRGLAPLAPITDTSGSADTLSDAAVADGVHGRIFIYSPTTTPVTITITVGNAALGSVCLVHVGSSSTTLNFVADGSTTVDAGATYNEAASVRGAWVLLVWIAADYVAVGGERDLP